MVDRSPIEAKWIRATSCTSLSNWISYLAHVMKQLSVTMLGVPAYSTCPRQKASLAKRNITTTGSLQIAFLPVLVSAHFGLAVADRGH